MNVPVDAEIHRKLVTQRAKRQRVERRNAVRTRTERTGVSSLCDNRGEREY